jgi:hypothetical protein
MRTLLLTLALVCLGQTAAHAETYTYKCRGGIAVANENNNTLTWRGVVFRNLKVVEGDCHVNWEATRAGVTARFCIATQGGAGLTIGKDRFECEQQVRDVRTNDTCSGVLSRYGDGLSLMNPNNDEGFCIVGKADASRVLQGCVAVRSPAWLLSARIAESAWRSRT